MQSNQHFSWHIPESATPARLTLARLVFGAKQLFKPTAHELEVVRLHLFSISNMCFIFFEIAASDVAFASLYSWSAHVTLSARQSNVVLVMLVTLVLLLVVVVVTAVVTAVAVVAAGTGVILGRWGMLARRVHNQKPKDVFGDLQMMPQSSNTLFSSSVGCTHCTFATFAVLLAALVGS